MRDGPDERNFGARDWHVWDLLFRGRNEYLAGETDTHAGRSHEPATGLCRAEIWLIVHGHRGRVVIPIFNGW